MQWCSNNITKLALLSSLPPSECQEDMMLGLEQIINGSDAGVDVGACLWEDLLLDNIWRSV